MIDPMPHRVMSDHIAWCEAERSNARAMIDLLTTYGARLQVHEFAGALRDITVNTVNQKRRMVEHLDAFLLSCGPGEDAIASVFTTNGESRALPGSVTLRSKPPLVAARG